MHLSYGSDLLTAREDGVELIVPQHEQTFVGHEHLKGVDPPLLGQRLHFLLDLQQKQVEWETVSIETRLRKRSVES